MLLLAIVYCSKLIAHGIDKFFVEFGSGSHTKYLNVVELFEFLRQYRSIALPSFTHSVAAIQHLDFTLMENVDSGITG